MTNRINELMETVEQLSSKSKNLEKKIDEIHETYVQTGTDDNALAQIPLIAAEASRGLLEAECRRWRRIAVLCAALLLATWAGIALSVLF